MLFACPEKYKRTRENVKLWIDSHPPQPSKVFLISHVWIYELMDMVSLENILCILCTSKTKPNFRGDSFLSNHYLTWKGGCLCRTLWNPQMPMHRLVHLCLAHGKHLPQSEHVLFCHNWKRTVVIWCADSWDTD